MARTDYHVPIPKNKRIKDLSKFVLILLILSSVFVFCACGNRAGNAGNTSSAAPAVAVTANGSPANEAVVEKTPKFPNLQAEILDKKNSSSDEPIGQYDFKNYTYPLPRGWQDKDAKDITLENGSRRTSEDQIGMSYVATKFGDVNGDGKAEAFVVLKIETAGSAIPQAVYVFSWKDGAPEIIWAFRTGDRTDGGLKNIYAENGQVVIELFGQDRFILGEVETMKITGDEEQLCCPEYFTRTRYKLNGRNFLAQGKRETRLIGDPDAPATENQGDIVNQKVPQKGKK